MKKIFFLLIIWKSIQLEAQYLATDVRHYIKIEGASLRFYASTLSEKTHELQFTDDGISFNGIYGWDFDEKAHLGIGGGYLGIGNISGASAFGEVNFYVSNAHLNPYIGARLGYSYILPKNVDGKGGILAEFVGGFMIKPDFYKYFSIYIQSGFMYDHKLLFVPIRLGVRF